MTLPPPAAPSAAITATDVVEGWAVLPTPAVAGAPYDPGRPVKAVVSGHDGAIRFNDELLSRHVLFVGAIGSGKTNAMMQLVDGLRRSACEDDVFVVFDTKGDFRDQFCGAGDAIISNERAPGPGQVVWSLAADLTADDPVARAEEIFEISSTIFAEEIEKAGDNMFFAVGARDVFAATVEAALLELGPDAATNAVLKQRLEGSQRALWEAVDRHPHLAGAKRYLSGDGQGPRALLAFMQQQVRATFSGAFGSDGDFSVRSFVRGKGAKALFVEYDIASGSLLLPVYRVLLDLCIKEALSRRRSKGNVFFVMDEFALLPQLSHIANGINFGRSLGLKFVVGTQNTSQVEAAYGDDVAVSILSGFGTVFAFRLMDRASRDFFRQRFGTNRKRVALTHTVASETAKVEITTGNVVEDWDLSGLGLGECLVSLPSGPPFHFRHHRFTTAKEHQP